MATTDRKAKERYIAEKNLRLQKLNQELVQFAYSASHGLKAPLASITRLLEYFEADLAAGDLEEVRSNLQKSRALTNRLAKRIEDMPQLAKSDMVANDWVEIDVADRVGEVWSTLKTEDVQFVADYQHENDPRTIAVRFDTIVENLLSNAVKYRDKQQGNSTVTVKTWNDPDSFCLTVEDNGIGIPKRHRERVFNLFQRASDTKEPGSGLGLAITKKNVAYLGGGDRLRERRGQDCVYRRFAPDTRNRPRRRRHSMKIPIVVVDYDEADRYLVQRAVRALEYESHYVEFEAGVLFVESITDEKTRKETIGTPPPPILVFLGINMPRMSGFEVLDHLQRIFSDSEQVIVVTMYT